MRIFHPDSEVLNPDEFKSKVVVSNADILGAVAPGWHTVTVDSFLSLGGYTSLALDGSDNPRIILNLPIDNK